MTRIVVRKIYTEKIKSYALELGFDACGISRVGFLEEDSGRLREWLEKEFHGEMSYMDNYFDKRCDPRKLVEGAKSIISVLLNYYPEKTQNDPHAPVVSKYAYGEDYHFVIKRKLKKLLMFMQEDMGAVHGRPFVDSAPVLERAWAVRGGLGWIGKNTMLISEKHGSFVFLGELIVDIELDYDTPSVKEYCGTCTKCMDACPTEAITQTRVVDGSKCISYFTIEKKGDIPVEMKGKFQNRMFGCDICQDVCPWNRKAIPHKTKEFNPLAGLLERDRTDWLEMTGEEFNNNFQKSALQRTGLKGLKRNLEL